MSLLRRRSAGRSCRIHGDNGCELQGESGPRTRAQDDREWRVDVDAILASLGPELADPGDSPWGTAFREPSGDCPLPVCICPPPPPQEN